MQKILSLRNSRSITCTCVYMYVHADEHYITVYMYNIQIYYMYYGNIQVHTFTIQVVYTYLLDPHFSKHLHA